MVKKETLKIIQKTSVCFFVSLLIINFASADLISEWKLNEANGTTTEDSVGNNDGALYNNPTWTTGYKGSALEFDGTDDYVEINGSSINDFNSKNITLSAWIYPHAFPNEWPRIIDRTYNGQFAFYLSGSGDMRVALNTLGTDCDTAISGCNIPANEWSHVVYSYDSSHVAVYINGTQCGYITTPSGALDSSSSNIRIGQRADGSNRAFDGIIDEIRIYNNALTAQEVEDLFESYD